MGIAQLFEDVITKHLRAHAAWMPITNNFKLGDYGLISNGVFTKMGNVQDDFGVSFSQAQGPEANLDFVSESTRVIKFAGGVEVPNLPSGAIDAKVVLKFEKERSLMVKAPTIAVTNIENVNALFEQLKTKGNWDRKFIVVFQTYFATDAVIISNIDAGTEISLSGDAKALESFKLGNAAFEVSSNKKAGLQLLGKGGIIALGLVRLKKPLIGKEKVTFLGPQDAVETEELASDSLEDDV